MILPQHTQDNQLQGTSFDSLGETMERIEKTLNIIIFLILIQRHYGMAEMSSQSQKYFKKMREYGKKFNFNNKAYGFKRRNLRH
jgi:hypothetical protein